jgi:oxygen-independent coproporphyrinogen-3 oxidase
MTTRTQLARLGLFDAKVPRYTSYPTAPHFSSRVGADDFARWIDALPENGQISLYVHIPFCRTLCWFCACRTQGTKTDAPVRAYLDTLKAELRLLAARLPAGQTLSRLHWGGGTPTLLNADMIRELSRAIFDVVPLGPGAEFSVEIDPGEIDAARLDALAEAGMNRASIGVQDFDPGIQQTIGRIQGFEATRAAVEAIRARGIRSLNADILFGLPDQSPERITASVQKLLSFSPDQVALYGYAHVPWMAKRQQMIPSDKLPTPEERLDLFETARSLFTWDGYQEIGIDHFALPEDGLAVAARSGRLRRNFQGYTDDQATALIGVGASSISRFPQGYAQNAPTTSAHMQAIREGRLSTARGHAFAEDDALRARIIEALMCDFRVSADELCDSFGTTRAALRPMFAMVADRFEGLVRVTDTGLHLLPEARPLARIVARAFDTYEMDPAGHSSAI